VLDNQQGYNELLPHLFRQEYAKLTAVLCNHFGLKYIEIAEDIASETFLKASENWAVNGVPENPAGWLHTVARNKTKDYLKRVSIFENHIKDTIQPISEGADPDFNFDSKIITDSQLALIFAVCNPINSVKTQICLALQILCAFSVEEIANAFLTNVSAIRKCLQRARAALRKDNFQIKELRNSEIQSRLETVLRTLYLLFNEGYFSRTNNRLIRQELCSEAVRLTLVLTENPLTNTTQTNALLALMCFQSSRLDARIDDKGESILFEQQDKNRWDKTLIEKGNYFLITACNGTDISKYHLEAGIAYWHTTPTDENKWQHILQLYNKLIQIEYSPITAINRTFAFAKVYGCDYAIAEAETLNLEESNYYYGLLGYLYAEKEVDKSIEFYKRAIELTKSKAERQALRKGIERLENEKQQTSLS
jgi:predicted RNA polymerase sigma factor